MINLILKLMETEALKTAFLKLANMSISASWLVLAILVLRLVLKKAPKWVNVLLWGIVAVRLICPFSIESALSLIPSTQTIPMNIEMAAKPAIDSGVEVVNSMVNPMIAASFTPNPAASANPLQIWIPLAAVIWAFGMVLMFLYTAISYWRLNRSIDTAVLYRDNIFQSEHVSSPFVLGIIKPKIYLPFHMNEQDFQHVVAHEQAHIRRKDHWWKPLGFLLLTVYWFNPLMWVAYVLLCRDIELACDEKVIEQLNSEQRANYTQALVACSVNRRMISACPLAFGEVDVKERVKSIMNYRKPTFWIIVVSTVACAVVAICFLTNPVEQDVVPGIYGSIDSSKWNITLEIDNVTPKGATIKLIQDGGYLPNRLFYGDDYSIERYENNQWMAVEPLNDLVWATIAYTVPLDDSITWNINWSNTFGELAPGLYRFCKSVSDHRAPGVTDHEVYTVEFIISDGESSGKRMLLAKVIDIHDGYFLVEPVEESLELSSASRIEVPVKNMEPSPEPKVGDILEIEYDGQLQETYPARINNPYSIKIAESIRRLSLNDVIILSQKGYDLTWADFDQFEYIETGFGLYIRRYEINDLFHFSIGGAGPNSKPMYMHLGVNEEDPDAYIDIRDGGVTEFISEHNSDSWEAWDRIPMVMVNGTLYLDTGKESTVTARCGVMDGEITSQVPGNEEPTVNDQSNFGIGYGYQYGPVEGTIEIFMNDKWWVFATEEARKEIQFPSEETNGELMIDPVVPVTVVNLITGEMKIVNSNPSIRAIQSLISSEWWAEGNPACDNDYKITVNDESYWYHSDCGTLTDINHDRCISLNESQKAAMEVLIEVGQDSDFDRYWLTVGEDGVKRIEVKTAYSSGGCENADGSLYQKGERIWLESLDGFLDLRGVSFTALDEYGQIIWQASIPDGEDNEGFTHLRNDDWNVTNIP